VWLRTERCRGAGWSIARLGFARIGAPATDARGLVVGRAPGHDARVGDALVAAFL
jgi:hypothetical protein